METSTPCRQGIRRSLLTTPVLSSPLRRSGHHIQNVSVLLERTDDEKERSNRRNMVAIQKRLTNISSTSSPLSEIHQLTEANQIQDHLQICTKLYTENKISVKNAWELHIIDIIRKIALTDTANVLQVAGTSLDIGAKVYAFRVDDLHTRGLQLASSVGRNNQEQNVQDNENEGNMTTSEQNKRRPNKKRKKMLTGDKKNTVDKEGKSIFAPSTQLESVMFLTEENIEVSATDNLFTFKLRTKPSTHQFMLMSQEKYWTNKSDRILQETEDVIDIEIPIITDFTSCKNFKGFEIGNWDPEEEEKQLALATNMQDVVFDDNGLPIAELDGSIHDIFGENDAVEEPVSDVEDHQEEFHAQIHGEIEHIVDAVPEENRVQTDYGYNTLVMTASGKFIDRIWAGPSHWKVKFIRRSSARFSGNCVQPSAKATTRKLKVFPQINFDTTKKQKITEKFIYRRAPPTVPVEKISLPLPELTLQSFHKRVDELFMRPDILRRKHKKERSCEEHDYEVPVYNYENPNDSQYCSQNNSFHDNEPCRDTFEEDGPAIAQQNYLNDNLVSVPEMVDNFVITYAMKSKKIDMKKLKAAVWKCLTHQINGSKSIIKPQTFSSMYKQLPSLLSDDMKKELSCHLALSALLHLCNENNLELKQHPNKDFTIMIALQ